MQERAFLHHDVAAHHGELAELCSCLDLGVIADAQRPGEDGVGINLGAFGHPDAWRDLESVDVGLDLARQDVSLDPVVSLVGSDVLPVGSVGDPAVDRGAAVEELGKDVGRPVDHLAGRHLGEHLGFHYVDAGVHCVGEHLAPGGLLQEPLDPAVGVRDDDAEFQRIGNPGEGDCHERLVILMKAHQIGQVDVGQRIT